MRLSPLHLIFKLVTSRIKVFEIVHQFSLVLLLLLLLFFLFLLLTLLVCLVGTLSYGLRFPAVEENCRLAT